MKSTPFALLAVAGAAAAAPSNKPQLSISVRDGSLSDLDGIEPTVTWSNKAESNGVNYEYGVELAGTTTDIANLPRRLWGRATKKLRNGWGVSTRADLDPQNINRAELQFDADSDENDLSLCMRASAEKGYGATVSSVELTKGFHNDGNRVTVSPRYDLVSRHADVVLTYDAGDTLITVVADRDDQEITISQRLNDDNIIAPTLTSHGNLSVEWEHKIDEDNSVRTKLRPNESIDVEWKDKSWTANVNMPLDGSTEISKANVSVKKEVNF